MLKRVPSSGHNYQDKVSRWFGKQTIYTFNIFQGKSASISLVFRLHNIAILGLVVRVIPALSTKSSPFLKEQNKYISSQALLNLKTYLSFETRPVLLLNFPSMRCVHKKLGVARPQFPKYEVCPQKL